MTKNGMLRGCVRFVEKNIRGAYVVYGIIGSRQYYGFSKKDAIRMYKDEYWKTEGQFMCHTKIRRFYGAH